MDCDEYRKAIAADPGGSFDGVEHGHACEACAAYTAELRALDARIGRALAIEVPELAMPELPPLADSGGAPAAGRAMRFAAPAWLALAAGIAIVAVFAIRGVERDRPYHETLANEVLAHMDHEESSRRVTTVAVSDSALTDVLEPKVKTLDTGNAIVSYAVSCVINGHLVPHLVVQGRSGPITVILMPEEDVDAVISLSGENVHGVILPADTGSVAIIGQREEQMAEVGEVAERVVESVAWSI